MRIVAGSARGRKIIAPDGLKVRPTAERVRQATFNALGARGAIEGARVLDLFAGSGAMGIEALSRGATAVTFVEQDRDALKCIRDNVETLGFKEQSTIVRADVNSWAKMSMEAFDLILVDPPYTYESWTALLDAMAPSLHNADPDLRGIAVLETPRPIALGENWEVLREQRYGGTVVTLAIPAELTTSRSAEAIEPREVTEPTVVQSLPSPLTDV
jgi:16S rRNA (guanine966-N2)-methyltransferase